jgi:hypothetical protein
MEALMKDSLTLLYGSLNGLFRSTTQLLVERRRWANGPVNNSLISSLWRDTPVLRNTDFNCERMVCEL